MGHVPFRKQCPIWWLLLRHKKHRPNFFTNCHLLLTTAFLQVSHNVIPCSCLQMGHLSLVPDVATVLLCMSFGFLDHLDLPEFCLNFPPSCLGASAVFGQPKANSLTLTSISSHLSRSTSLGCNSNFRLLHHSAITEGSLLMIAACCPLLSDLLHDHSSSVFLQFCISCPQMYSDSKCCRP